MRISPRMSVTPQSWENDAERVVTSVSGMPGCGHGIDGRTRSRTRRSRCRSPIDVEARHVGVRPRRERLAARGRDVDRVVDRVIGRIDEDGQLRAVPLGQDGGLGRHEAICRMDGPSPSTRSKKTWVVGGRPGRRPAARPTEQRPGEQPGQGTRRTIRRRPSSAQHSDAGVALAGRRHRWWRALAGPRGGPRRSGGDQTAVRPRSLRLRTGGAACAARRPRSGGSARGSARTRDRSPRASAACPSSRPKRRRRTRCSRPSRLSRTLATCSLSIVSATASSGAMASWSSIR